MTAGLFHGRRAVSIENDVLRVTVLEEGGHIAEVYDKRAGVSPLWIPHWDSVEPSDFDPNNPGRFGTGPDAKLLAGIMGHNLCLDLFGGPSEQEAQAGLTVHGEASVDRYSVTENKHGLTLQLTLPLAQIALTRTIQLYNHRVRIHETLESLTATDRPVAWTQHVTLSPPFLDPATTEFCASMAQSVVSMADPGCAAYLDPGAEFDWPIAPRADGGSSDLRKMHAAAPASGYTAHVADLRAEQAYFIAFNPQFQLAFGYIWRRVDFPWLGIWEENCSRQGAPWDGVTVTRGMEFGVSPFPETRREMVDRNQLLGLPTYRWLPALGRLEAEYWIVSQPAQSILEGLTWPAV